MDTTFCWNRYGINWYYLFLFKMEGKNMKCQYCGSHNCYWIYDDNRRTKMYYCKECELVNVWKSEAIPVKT